MSKIKSGYRMIIKSWENDLDNYNTVVVNGLTKEQAAFYKDLCDLLKKDEYQNLYEPSKKEEQKFLSAVGGDSTET